MTESDKRAGEKFSELVALMRQLRAPGGCPWDRKQTFQTIKSYLLEESYEVMDAIDQADWPALEDELGDLLLQPVFLACIAEEADLFTISTALEAITAKLIRRHPHVFGNAFAETAADVKVHWEAVKQKEREAKGTGMSSSLLDQVPRNLPALVEAEKVGKKAGTTGFDWPDTAGVLAKVVEESRELTAAQSTGNQAELEHELGDLLFTVVNLSRHLHVDPEQALRKANSRFRSRFRDVEASASLANRSLQEMSLDELEALWVAAKAKE